MYSGQGSSPPHPGVWSLGVLVLSSLNRAMATHKPTANRRLGLLSAQIRPPPPAPALSGSGAQASVLPAAAPSPAAAAGGDGGLTITATVPREHSNNHRRSLSCNGSLEDCLWSQ